mmetsp:Transcript_45033/g.118055  ORF Transcript_45033/g.118055 Transcript_45033/m.118055 type:complete len:100 (-) Transcript_45033:732-1031(-)
MQKCEPTWSHPGIRRVAHQLHPATKESVGGRVIGCGFTMIHVQSPPLAVSAATRQDDAGSYCMLERTATWYRGCSPLHGSSALLTHLDLTFLATMSGEI